MDQSATSTITNNRRLSKLPLPRSSVASGSNDGSSLPKRTTRPLSGIFAASQLPSASNDVTAVSKLSTRDGGNALQLKKNVSRLQSTPKVQDTIQEASPSDGNLTSPSKQQSTLGNTSAAKDPTITSPVKIARKPRPSLSDRTLETLSQIPPSPSPRRRQSGFFTNESPMRPPSRTAAAPNHSRPGSRTGYSINTIPGSQRPPSPHKKIQAPATTSQPTNSTSSKRAVSSFVPRRAGASEKDHIEGSTHIPQSRIQLPGSVPLSSTPKSMTGRTLYGSKTVVAQSSSTRCPVKGLFGNGVNETTGGEVSIAPLSRTKKAIHMNGHDRSEPKASRPLIPKPAKPKQATLSDREPQESRKVSASSQRLRETIAKAKAARRNATIGSGQSNVPRAVAGDSLGILGVDVDPFSLDLSESGGANILRKRINSARTDGRLNIAALGLKEIPREVMEMYDYDTGNEGSTAWYENVDLVRLIAADNEITELKEDAFPDAEAADISLGSVFRGLEVVDLHGNQLKALPHGLTSLSRLTLLNLSRNRLTNDALAVISCLTSLKELRLAENSLEGALSDTIDELKALEILDLHGNAIESIPFTIEKITNLKVLNVGGNRLASLPLAALGGLPLSEITASHNRLSGSFFSPKPPQFSSLQTLDLSHNALVFVGDPQLDLPLLHTFDVSSNRLTSLPDMANLQRLITLNASENQIRTIPEGFTSLKVLKTADFGGNNLLALDDGIGMMDSLTFCNISNNPIRERRLLRLTTEDLKLELRVRLSSQESLDGTLSDHTSPTGAKPQSLAWPVKSGVLDRSHTKLGVLNRSDLEAVAFNDEVKSFVLHHNPLQTISTAYEALGNTLTSLDLSYNKYGQNSAYIAESVSLPSLQTLNLTSNGLTTLDPLVTHLSAPSLTTLILPFNRLSALPQLCTAFPALSKLMAANNAIVNLDVDSIRGLQVLDVSSNEIAHLPARLALLQGQLRTLMVNGNRFRVPGWGVLEKGTEEILNWCRNRIPAGEEGAVEDDVD